MEIKAHSFPNLGYLTTDVPVDLLNELQSIIHEKELEKANEGLAGNIKKEFLIPKAIPLFEQYIIDLSLKYDETFNYLKTINTCTNDVPMILQRMWVNFQEKHEFNPPHDHNGIFSFVIWVKVPFYEKEELDISPGKNSNYNVPGYFEFLYTDALGNIKGEIIPVDKKMEGKLCLFPAKLNHCVYPFYSSNDYRISVSGNIALKT